MTATVRLQHGSRVYMSAELTITHEPINSRPLLRGSTEAVGMRSTMDAQGTPPGTGAGARGGTSVRSWLAPLRLDRDPRLLRLRDGAPDRAPPINPRLHMPLRAPACPAERLANLLSRLGDPALPLTLAAALLQPWGRG